jgi:hypothetical protein
MKDKEQPTVRTVLPSRTGQTHRILECYPGKFGKPMRCKVCGGVDCTDAILYEPSRRFYCSSSCEQKDIDQPIVEIELGLV